MNVPRYAALAAELLGRRVARGQSPPGDRERGRRTIERALRARTHCGPDAICDFRTNRCVHTCEDEIDCPAVTPDCDRGLCFGCDGDHHCEQSALGRYCAADRRGCVECREADDCPEQCDTLWGRCVECLDGHDCDSGFCDPAGSVCLP